MTDQHCPGFETNKKLDEIKLKCPDCGQEIEIFSDEVDKHITCPGCKTTLDPKVCATT